MSASEKYAISMTQNNSNVLRQLGASRRTNRMNDRVSSAAVVGLSTDHAVCASLHVVDGLSFRPRVHRSRLERQLSLAININRHVSSDHFKFVGACLTSRSTLPTEVLGHQPIYSPNHNSSFNFMQNQASNTL